MREIKKSQSSYNFRVNEKVKIYKRNAFNDVIRELEIRRENLILAKKIKHIGEEYKISNTLPHQPSLKILLDVKAIKKKPVSPPKLKKSKTLAGYKSLNCEKRKKEMLRITLDNLNLRDRILGMKSMYNQDQWRDHTRKHFHY